MSLSGECVISSVLSRHNKNLKRRASVKALGQTVSQLSDRSVSQFSDRSVLKVCVAAQSYLENKGKYILETWGHDDPKDTKRESVREREWETEREKDPRLFGSSFYMFFIPSPWAVCSTWGAPSSPRIFLCSIFTGFSLPCCLATAILDCFFLF